MHVQRIKYCDPFPSGFFLFFSHVLLAILDTLNVS